MRRTTYDRFMRRAEDAPPAAVTLQMVTDAVAQAINALRTDLPNMITSTVNPLIEQRIPRQQPPAPTNQPPAPTNQPPSDPQVAAMLHRLEEENRATKQQLAEMQNREKEANARAEQADRENAIRTAMGTYAFASDSARESAFRLLNLDIQRTDQGVLVGPNNLPLADYVKDSLTKTHDYLLAPADTTGSGAARGVTRQVSTVGLESIKQGMSSDDRAVVVQEITRAVNAAQAA